LDITQLLLDDHQEQRRLFSILEQIDRTDTNSLRVVWNRLSTFLEVHAEAEERIFYPALLALGRGDLEGHDPRHETLDAIRDHNDIRDSIAAVAGEAVGSAAWYKAIAAVNEANSDHMAEEEREGMTDFRLHVDRERRHELAVAFISFEVDHVEGVEAEDKDPKRYLDEHA
jgi:hypothetical protein